jgi:dolichol kinase
MKTVTLKRRRKIGRRLSKLGKELSVERVVAQFQSALLCIDQFGFCGGLIMASFMVTSFLVQAARAVVEKGII